MAKNTFQLSFDQTQLDRVMAEFGAALPAQIDRAVVRALNRTALWLKTRAVRGAAAETGIAQKHLRRRLRATKARRRRLIALLWGGMNEIRVSTLGKKPRQTRTGTNVGRKSWPGAFIATTRGGHTDVWRRQGDARLPISPVKIQIAPAMERTIRGLEADAGRQLLKELSAQLNYEINVRGK